MKKDENRLSLRKFTVSKLDNKAKSAIRGGSITNINPTSGDTGGLSTGMQGGGNKTKE